MSSSFRPGLSGELSLLGTSFGWDEKATENFLDDQSSCKTSEEIFKRFDFKFSPMTRNREEKNKLFYWLSRNKKSVKEFDSNSVCMQIGKFEVLI